MEKTPQRMGYLTYDEWAKNVSRQFQEVIDKAVAGGDYAMATYYKLLLQEHQAQVEKVKKFYRGV